MLIVQNHAGRLGSTMHAPSTWSEADELLHECGESAAVAGGATYLMWRASQGEPMPEHLVSLHRITDDRHATEGAIGALATLRALERGIALGPQRALTMAASFTAGPAIRTVATLGGNLASGFPQADLVPALLALNVDVHLSDGTHTPIEALVAQGMDRRLIHRVTHDVSTAQGWTGASIKLSRRGMDLSVGTASAVLRVVDDEILEARVAVGSLVERPVRLSAIEAALVGADPSEATIREVLDVVGFAGLRFADDEEATSTYRAYIAEPLVRRALTVAARLGTDTPHALGDARL